MLRKLTTLAAALTLAALLAAPLALAQQIAFDGSCCPESPPYTEADSNQLPTRSGVPFTCPPVLGNPPGSSPCILYDNGEAVAPDGQLFFVDENGIATLPDGRVLSFETGFLQYS